MKKMILLLVLPFTILMAIDFTMTEKGLFAETTTQDPAPGTGSGETSSYLEPVNLPECDASNPEVQFIRNKTDWSKINSSSKRIFCVSPGDYRSLGNINITASGTIEKRRYIVLNNENDRHPGKLSAAQRANYKLRFNNASYWTIDRQSAVATGSSISRGIDFQSGSSFNIVNRMFTGGGIGNSVTIKRNCNNNTIQNSRFTEQKTPSDMVAINLIEFDANKWSAKNNKIINNEFVNQNDGIQVTISKTSKTPNADGRYPFQEANVAGLIIDGNIFYLDEGTTNYEQAIDMKTGSDNPNNPVLITNNKMWGYKQPRGHGDSVMVLHHSVKNIKVNNNIMFNSKQTFGTGANGVDADYRYGTINGEVKNNLIYNCGDPKMHVMLLSGSKNLVVENNTIIEGKYSYGKFAGLTNGSKFLNNILVDTTSNYAAYNNNATFTDTMVTTKIEDRSLYTKDLTFTYDNYTNNPKTMVLENVLKQ